MANIFHDFKEFAVKGNMIDIAVGVIIGTAFNKIIDVLVKEVFLPPLTLLTDGLAWEDKRYVLREAVIADGQTQLNEVAIGYGKLIEVSVDFLIIAITTFIVIRFMNRVVRKAQDAKDPTVVTPKNIELMSKVVDLLEQQNELLLEQKKQ